MKDKKKMQMGGMMPQTDMSYMPKKPKQVGMMYGGMSVKPKKMMKGGKVAVCGSRPPKTL